MKRAWPWVVAAALGFAAQAQLQPRVDPYADLGYSISRRDAVAAARKTAEFFGVDPAGWDAYVAAEGSSVDQRYSSRSPAPPANRFVAGVQTQVRLSAPASESHFDVTLTPTGQVLSFAREPVPSAKAASANGPTPPAADRDPAPGPGDVEAAERTLRFLVGDSFSDFVPLGPPSRADEGWTWSWRAALPSPEIPSVKASCRVSDGAVVGAKVEPNFSSSFLDGGEPGADAIWFFLVLVLALATVLIGLAHFLMGAMDGLFPVRKALWAAPILAALWLVNLLAQGGADWRHVQGAGWFSIAAQNTAFWLFFLLPLILAICGGGLALASRVSTGPVLTMDLLAEGKLLHRPVGASLAAGLGLAGALATLPMAVAASGLFPGAALQQWSPLSWVGVAPSLPGMSWLEGPLVAMGLYFAVLRPLCAIYVSRPGAVWGLRFLGGTLLLSLWPVRDSTVAVWLSAAAIWGLAEIVHRRFGVLAILAMGLGAGAAVRAGSLMLQPSPAIHHAGILSLVWLGAGVLLFSAVALFGRPVHVAEETRQRDAAAREKLGRRRAERERLMAEFAVARRAQELMLPAAPPRLAGLDISSVCRPAREVGGDLFDFLPLNNGELGVVVADVAGKGVPAALYMTLTKGLLASVCENHHTPAEIASELNDHFHFSGRRSVFLTMALGVLDPETGRVRCVRAGHNPLVWRRASRDETVQIKPSGIGLGLAPSHLLRRSLGVQEVAMEAGDALFFYSDGVTEAMNARSEEYGEDRLNAVIAACDGLTADQTRDRVLEDVERFVGDTPANDDITLVVLKRLDGDSGPG